jgi:glucose/arabinose dehydrogenase
MRKIHVLVLAALALAGVACADRSPTTPGDDDNGGGDGDGNVEIRFVEVASGLASPVDLTAPANDARLFVVEQPGRVRIIRDGVLLATPFLDITGMVGAGGERGLLGLAFHPQYETNGRFFVHYTDTSGNSRVDRYTVSSSPDLADLSTGAPVLAVQQPQGNHNGGQIAFGVDGMLYIALGDGGGSGDPGQHGQNPNTLLGSLLRIDVDGAAPYGIPASNPYAGGGGRGEIWAIGLRNPWRFSFDAERGLLYIADVGQNRREEVNVQPAAAAALNYGWNEMEGTLCYPPGTSCDPEGLVLPAVEYENPSEGCSVTGGYVYRGTRIPSLRGHYLYGDYCRGWVRSFHFTDDGTVVGEQELGTGLGNITSFGRDGSGEVYVLTAGGRVLRVEPR